MAGLLFIEGFETFGANGDTGSGLQDIILQKWAEINVSTSAKLNDSAYEGQGLCLDFVAGSTTYALIHNQPPISAEMIVGFAWYTGSLNNTGYIYYTFSTGVQIGLYYHTGTGELRIYRGAWDVIAGATGLLQANTWYYFELKYKIDDTTGYWEFYINGSLMDSKTDIDTEPAGHAKEICSHRWSPWINTNVRIDDIYIYDNTGDVQEPFGPVKVRALLPDGDDTTDWTSTGANHYDQVNDVPVDTANYVESDTANDVDLFTFANSADPSNWPIYGVQLNVYAAVTDVGIFTLEGIADSNGTQDTANEAIIDNLGGQYCFVFEDDPETSNAWTMDQLNDAKFGVGVE